ncbi:PREDICTED: APO [Prunus dulcis]|uniref:PREDICTED: APO n=1 Tax=Prunus dulcis TaxID=3755 RepID=A0A5E4G7Y1_PRUDU|nr:PREDICTED: APO [Prunus dulcis]
MDSWFEMISGAKKIMEKYSVKKIMEKYSVKTCGYCLEVQVDPKGHKVRMCKASKRQSRNGLHAWQEATIEDLAGATVPDEYRSMMRLDMGSPERDEVDLVA